MSIPRRLPSPLAALALALAAVAPTARGQDGAPPRPPERPHGHGDHGGEHDDGPTVHRRFDDPRRAERMFEDPGRDAWQRPERVLEVLALPRDARVADVGAATGYFAVRLARACPEGVVYAVDVEWPLVNYLNLRARRERLGNLVALVCAPDDPGLPEPVDLVFVCDTYHHLGRRVDYARALRERVRPGGRLVIVDYDEGVDAGPPHKLPAAKVVAELARAGWRLERREDLPRQYLLAFVLDGDDEAAARLRRAHAGLDALAARVLAHRAAHGALPAALADLGAEPAELTDPWGHPFAYAPDEGSFVVRSLGRDGRPGGAGEDADATHRRAVR